jgi:predicted nucleic acid-binding protein
VRALVWDASALHHAARADRLDVFGDLAKMYDNVTTAAVVEELAGYGLAEAVERSSWSRVVHVDGLDELPALVGWVAKLSAGEHHRGEATVCAWADVHGAIAVIDDGDARRTARAADLDVHGSLWVFAAGVRAGAVGMPAVDGLVATLVRKGARYPLRGETFSTWARTSGLL